MIDPLVDELLEHSDAERDATNLDYGIVVTTAPLTVLVGSSTVAAPARQTDGFPLTIGDHVAVLIAGADRLVLGKTTATPTPVGDTLGLGSAAYEDVGAFDAAGAAATVAADLAAHLADAVAAHAASAISFVPTGSIAAGDVQSAIAETASEAASAVAAEVTARNTAIAAAIAALIASAPGLLDTLDEIAAALGDDPNFATTITTALAGKQPLHANLTALAGLVGVADRLGYFTGAGTMALTTFTTFARTLLDDPDAATMRATLVLGTAATHAHTDYATAAQGATADTAVQPARTISTTAPLTGGGDLSANRTLAISAATDTTTGAVELATAAEVLTGTDTTRAVTAAGVAGAYALKSAVSGRYVPLAAPVNKVAVSAAGAVAALNGTWQDVDLSAQVPAAAVAAQIAGLMRDTNAVNSAYLQLRCKGVTSGGARTVGAVYEVHGDAQYMPVAAIVPVDSNRKIQWLPTGFNGAGTAEVYIDVVGYFTGPL